MIRIEPLSPGDQPEAVRLLASAFVTNPLHVAVFGPMQIARNEAFFRIALSAMKGPTFAAVDGARMVGAIHWVESPGCQFSAIERLRLLPAMTTGFGLRSLIKTGSWLSSWSRRDPDEPHLHLGPIGVLPQAQGRHVGHTLMQRYCELQDLTGQIGYLETDRSENVGFYRRFGFETIGTAQILGVTNYFMLRRATKGAAG